MTPSQIAGAVRGGSLSAQEAVRQLVVAGETEADAGNFVFEALGGGDVIETDANGVPVFRTSQRPVAEVKTITP